MKDGHYVYGKTDNYNDETRIEDVYINILKGNKITFDLCNNKSMMKAQNFVYTSLEHFKR